MSKWKRLMLSSLLGGTMMIVAACGGGNGAQENEADSGSATKELSGEVIMDGSSTVYPIAEAAAEEYMMEQPNVKVSVGASGTGGGFEKFTKGETDFSNASRPIKEEEKQAAADNGIEFQEFQLAYDGLSVVVNKENDWVDYLTVDELKKMWTEDGTVKKWSDIRPGWPDEEIKFFSPGHDSGTYDYFDEVILEGKELVKTAQLSEDDNILVRGVEGDQYAIGYFGYAYYLENKDKLKVVPIDGGNGPVEPTNETIETGKYTPLSRPLFTYVNVKSLKEKPQVYDYMEFLLETAGDLAEEVGYVRLPEEKYKEQLETLEGLK
ncbi:PstS family phosphate ABC transporter substrate-binding protein [Geobacillus sp. FSL K6-0789]|uniref:Phosphate-binding protein n=1 Tax=Geobacillus stearothermophilus TaxID=1422 RepID=A0A3L7DBX4_GEOSE|nr:MULTISPECIES: PstS family phosphate ABC transporter substrate-binding protein [Geobacillus]KAF6510012.1 Phosphate ABC transporter periplasmic phosphate-binding protein PstS [Geobacillus stearothermophilus]KMY58306.1 phosphate-binding protein [Geobacillus stearothermophilus]KMY58588.1 phosphate-binding protein [Geobacillus stearothermophilus]KMY59153.1 phosphate-binding protein [Geobacillus stearothermophilus]MBR2517766.1 PstS family phosphate ABC transporter substrate-binding protein [Geoba